MDLYFWNVSNTKAAIDAIATLDFTGADVVFAIAEFWEIADYVGSMSHKWNFLYNEASGRAGVVFSKQLTIRLERGYPFYSRYSIERVGRRIHLYVLHLQSMRHSEIDAARLNTEIARGIVGDIENSRFSEVVILGDFNLPHFHEVFLSLYLLNATDYFNERLFDHKRHLGAARLKFYSPIMSFSGDLSPGPPGTYYFPKGTQSQAWHILDNILVSYPLAGSIDKRRCAVLDEINGLPLVGNNGRPDQAISDHLPIRVAIA